MFCASIVLTSCEGFLNREPISDIGSKEYFKDEISLLNYTNGFIQKYTPSYTTLGYGDGYSDIMATKQSTEFLYSPEWTAEQQTGWSSGSWTAIYNINYFLAHFKEAKGLTEAEYNHYEGTARFWRAWQYFSKVKSFGDVPWYTEPIDPDDEEALYKPRDSREYVMGKILEDLDFAAEHCFSSGDWVNGARINKYIALAVKSQVCLFEGTYRKYHTKNPSTNSSWLEQDGEEKYLNACKDACEELMSSGVYSIVHNPADVATQYRKLFTEENLNYNEVIWGRQMSTGLSVLHELTWRFTSGSYGQKWSLDQDFVNTYLNLDGTRYTKTEQEFVDEIQNRDYRLSQSVITPGYTKVKGGAPVPTAPDFTITLTGYQMIKYNIDNADYESARVSYNSLPIIRYAEVLLNYAEAMAELGSFDDQVWNSTIKVLRERAGVSGVRPTIADSYLENYYGLSDVDLLEIRRERAIELLLEGRRYDDLMRWKLGDLLNKTWYGIYVPALDVAYDLNDDGINDVCFTKGAAGSEPGVVYIIIDDETYSLENGNSGRLIYNVERFFTEKRYLRPIPKVALDINPDLGQNYYWQ